MTEKLLYTYDLDMRTVLNWDTERNLGSLLDIMIDHAIYEIKDTEFVDRLREKDVRVVDEIASINPGDDPSNYVLRLKFYGKPERVKLYHFRMSVLDLFNTDAGLPERGYTDTTIYDYVLGRARDAYREYASGRGLDPRRLSFPDVSIDTKITTYCGGETNLSESWIDVYFSGDKE